MDLFELPKVSLASHVQEAAIQVVAGQKAAFLAACSIAASMVFAANGMDGKVTAMDTVADRIKDTVGDTRTARRWIANGKNLATYLRKNYGKGRADDTCRGVVREIRDAETAEAARTAIVAYLEPKGVASQSSLMEFLGKGDEPAKREPKAAPEATAAPSEGSETDTKPEADATPKADPKLDAIMAIVAGIRRRGQDLGFTSNDYASIVALILHHVHGEDLAEIARQVEEQQTADAMLALQADATEPTPQALAA